MVSKWCEMDFSTIHSISRPAAEASHGVHVGPALDQRSDGGEVPVAQPNGQHQRRLRLPKKEQKKKEKKRLFGHPSAFLGVLTKRASSQKPTHASNGNSGVGQTGGLVGILKLLRVPSGSA